MGRGGASIEPRKGDSWGIIVGLIILIAVSLLLMPQDDGFNQWGSSYNTQVGGLSGIYHVFESRGEALRWERPPAQLPPEVDVMLLWRPGAITDADRHDLLNWVASGHTLVINGQMADLPGTVRVVEPDLAQSAAAHPVTVGVHQVAVGAEGVDLTDQPVIVHLTRPDGVPVLVSWAHREGRIFWSIDGVWLTNSYIEKEDNLSLALNLLSPGPGRQVAFDEYHHQIRAPQRWWQILRGPLRVFAIVVAFAIFLFYLSQWSRFGAPQAVLPAPPRAAAEYVYSMSQLFRRAQAREVVLKALYRSLTTEMGRMIGGVRGLSHEQIAQRVGERVGILPDKIRSLLDRTQAERSDKIGEKALIALAEEATQIQRRMRNAGCRDQ